MRKSFSNSSNKLKACDSVGWLKMIETIIVRVCEI